MAYSVNLWGSKPGTNDDCWTGEDYATRAEAEAAFQDPWGVGGFNESYYRTDGYELWIELDGDDVHTEQQLQRASRRRQDDEWAREIATQAGFAFGCDGYNDALGY